MIQLSTVMPALGIITAFANVCPPLGFVIVQFVVNSDGSIVDPQVVKPVNPYLDKEALRVVSSMPNWKPGEQRGKKVRVRFTLPVTFRLSN